MEILKYILLVLEVLVGIMLIGVILMQRSKEQGLGLAFGSGMGEAMFGARTGDVLTKITIVLAIVFFVNTVVLARMFAAQNRRSVMDRVPAQTAQPAAQPPPGATSPAQLPPAQMPGEIPAPPTGIDQPVALPPVEVPAIPAPPVDASTAVDIPAPPDEK